MKKILVFIGISVLALFLADLISAAMDGNTYLLVMDSDFVHYMTGYLLGGLYFWYVEGFRPLF